MTAGNRVQVPTPFMPSTATGGPDPTEGLGNPEINAHGGVIVMPLVGSDAEAPAGSTTPGPDHYGTGRSGNASMQDMNGPGTTETTFGLANADASGNQSMQDMGGANLGMPTRAMNTDPGQSLPGKGNDHNWNDMESFE